MATELELYRSMALARAFELVLAELWQRGLISGEMHLGTGEEAVAAGVASCLSEGDALALDHRCTPWLLLRGVDPTAMLREMLGREDGLCGGRGGHMHLMSATHLAAASGIVGAAGPLASGFALAASRLRPGMVAVATFGDGAVNQGMLMESFNLAAAWRLPVLFVCKDNGWAITTESPSVTGGDPATRAAGFGLHTESVDGLDPVAVAAAAGRILDRARRGEGPGFLHCRCSRLDGHFLGDPMLRTSSQPLATGLATVGRVARGAIGRGTTVGERARALLGVTGALLRVRKHRREAAHDPLVRARTALVDRTDELDAIDRRVTEQAAAWIEGALDGGPA